MFTGIVQTTSPIVSAAVRGGIRRVSIKKPPRWKLTLGASIAVDGICSTVVKRTASSFDVEYMPETISKTTAGAFARGRVVNLERPLAFGASLDGHLVEGHVDTRGRIIAVVELGRSRELVVSMPKELARRIVLHGAVCVDGVSLTAARKGRASFTVALVPFTLAHTNLKRLSVGDEVNIEVDRGRSLAFTLRLRKRGGKPPRKETKGSERAKRVEGRIAQGEARRLAAAYFAVSRGSATVGRNAKKTLRKKR